MWIAIGCFQVVATPFVYAVVRHIASGNGRPSAQFAHILVQNIEKFVNVLCLCDQVAKPIVSVVDERSCQIIGRLRGIAWWA